MAKFAVLLFAALAFQAASAGVYRRNQIIVGDLENGLEDYKSGQLENLVGQLQIVARDVSVSLETALPHNRQIAKTLTWQSRELAQYIDTIVGRLQVEANNYSGKIAIVLEQVISELRGIQISLKQTAGYTDLSIVSQLKNQLNTNIQNAAEQIEKLVRLVQIDIQETQGSLRAIVRGIITDFVTVIQKIQTQIQSVAVEGGQSPRHLAIQIQEVTNGLTASLQGLSQLNAQQVRLALREYAQNVEAIITRLQEVEGIVGNVDITSIIKQVNNKLRRVLVPIAKIIDAGIIEGADIVRSQLIRELQIVAEGIEQLVQYTLSGSQQTLIQEVLGDYLSAIQQVRIQIQGGLYGQDTLLTQNVLLGEDTLLGQDALLGQGALLRKNVYQGLYSGLLGKSGLVGKYQGLPIRGKGLAIQIQAVASDLSQIFQNIHVDNVLVRQTLINLIREYAVELETIVERLQEVTILEAGVGITKPQEIAQNLRQIVVALRQIDSTGSAISTAELRSQLSLQVQNTANELQILVSGLQSGTQQVQVVKNVIIRFLTVTRNLKIQLLNISHVAQQGQTSTGFGFQIQTLANGLVAALESVSVENRQARQFLLVQAQELAQNMESIVERLQSYSGVTTGRSIEIPQEIAQNLRQLVASLRQVVGIETVASAQQLRTQLIVIIQDAASEIQKLLWVGQNWQIQGEGQVVNTILYVILNDFVAALQNQQIQLQTIYQSSRYGQNSQQLAIQIQAISNNLAIYLQNVPAKGEQTRQNIEIQARKLAQYIENLVDRLEIEITNNSGSEIAVLQQVVLNLKQVVVALEQVTAWETTNSVYGLSYQLNVVLQHVASEMKRLSWVAQSDLYQAHGNLNTIVRSVLVQYLVVLQHVQIELQGINQTVQIGQTPRELALQIQIIARRLTGILRVAVPEDRHTQISLIRQARYLSQIIENILTRLQVKISTGNGNVVLQQIVSDLRQIQLALQQAASNVDVISTTQLKAQLAVFIQDAAVEIQKLMWVAQSDIQQGQANVNALVKGVLIDFLAGLQNLQMQIQTHLQIVLGGQHPRALAIQIQSVGSRLLSFLQWAQLQPNSQQLRQTLVIQIGELTQTIENLVLMIQAQIKNNGENSQVLHEIVAQLTKLSLTLQKLNGVESGITVNELSAQLAVVLQNVISEIERLAYLAQAQLQENQAVNTNGVLQGVLNNFLATLRTMLIQLQNTRQFGYGQNTKELANQIQTVSTKLTTSLEIVAIGTKQVRQALAIQTLKYARRIQHIVDRLETEVSHKSEIDVNTLEQVAINLRQIVVSLQQVGGSLVTKTTTELRHQLTNQIQNAGAEIQKLLLAQSTLQQNQGIVSTVVKSVLVEYLAAVQNLQIQVQFISQASQKGLTLPQLAIYIEAVISDISVSLQRVAPTNRLVGETITVESRQLAKVLANIANKLQTESVSVVGRNVVLEQVASQLKEIQLVLQQISGVSSVVDIRQQRIQLEVSVQRAIVAIERLVYAVQPQLEQIQIHTGIVSVVREVLNEFLLAVQNVQIQLQNVLQVGQTDLYSWGLGLQGQKIRELGLEGQYVRGWGLSGQGSQYSSGLGLYGRQYFGGKLVDRQIAQTPQLLVNQIQSIAGDLSATLQSSTVNGQQATQILSVQARELVQIIRNIISQVERIENVDSVIQQVIYRLREVELSLQRLAVYNVFTNAHQLRVELDNYVQIVVAQIEKLVLIAQEETRGNWYYVIKSVLNVLLNGLQEIRSQVQIIAQVGYADQSGYGLQGRQSRIELEGVSEIGLQGLQYGYGRQGVSQYGLEGSLKSGYGLKGRNVQKLATQIQIVASQVADELQTVAVSDNQVRQVLIIQSRQLIQIIDNIVDRLQVELTLGNGNVVQQVSSNLRQIRLQLQQVVNSGVITTVYQIKAQIANYIQEIASELQKLALIAQSDVQEVQIVKDVLVQYLVYLRQIQYQLQYNVLGYQNTNRWGSQLSLTSGDLAGSRYNTIYARQLRLGSNIDDASGLQNWNTRLIAPPERVYQRSMDSGAHLYRGY